MIAAEEFKETSELDIQPQTGAWSYVAIKSHKIKTENWLLDFSSKESIVERAKLIRAISEKWKR